MLHIFMFYDSDDITICFNLECLIKNCTETNINNELEV